MQDLAPEAPGAGGSISRWQGTLVQQGLRLATAHLQALGLSAMTAEVHEGRPGEQTGDGARGCLCRPSMCMSCSACCSCNKAAARLPTPCCAPAAPLSARHAGFCAPPVLTLSVLHSGSNFGQPLSGSVAHGGKAVGGGGSPCHVLLSSSFWLDNRSGLNLVLSDLDRRMLRGLPGPGLKCERWPACMHQQRAQRMPSPGPGMPAPAHACAMCDVLPLPLCSHGGRALPRPAARLCVAGAGGARPEGPG